MEITRQQFHLSLLQDLDIIRDPEDEGGNENPFFYSDHSLLDELLSRDNWFRTKGAVAYHLRRAADEFIARIARDYPEHLDFGRYNFCYLKRKAAVLDSFTNQVETIEIEGINQSYWFSNHIDPAIVDQDYRAINNGRFLDIDPEGEQMEEEYEDMPDEEEGGNRFGFLRGANASSMKGYAAIAIVTIMVVVVLMFVATKVVVPMLSGGSAPEGMGEVQQQPAPQVVPTPVLPQGSTSGSALSPELLAIKSGMISIGRMVVEQSFVLLALMQIAIAFRVFRDAQDRADSGDAKIFLLLLGAAALVFVFPIMDSLFPGNQSLVFMTGLVINMKDLQGLIIIVSMIFGLYAVSRNGSEDYTPMGAGFFILGFVFFMTQPSFFLAWQPPFITKLSWGIGLIVQLLELTRKQRAKVTIILTVLAGLGQLIIMLALAGALSTVQIGRAANYVWVISFIVSLLAITAFLRFGLGILSTQRLVPLAGVLSGVLTDEVRDSAHDAIIMLLMLGSLFIIRFWV